jgi:hypothetical protein
LQLKLLPLRYEKSWLREISDSSVSEKVRRAMDKFFKINKNPVKSIGCFYFFAALSGADSAFNEGGHADKY